MKKRLIDLLEGVSDYSYKGKDVHVSGITDDSRKVKKGYLFIAIKGLTVDGHKYIDAAVKKGAVAVAGQVEPKEKWLKKVTYVKINDTRMNLGNIASSWFDNPSEKLTVIGVTGTDGKTTTSSILYHMLKTAGKKVGLITTVGAKVGGKEYDTGFHTTNPDPIPLQKLLKKMVNKRCKYVVLEVTSHGLAQGRVEGISFDTAIFTNITHEHLDYHGSFENYRDAKGRLVEKATKSVVLNKDDESYDYLKSKVGSGVKVYSYSLENKKASIYCMKRAEKGGKTDLVLANKEEKVSFKTPLIGSYNMSNIMAAYIAAMTDGVKDVEIKKALQSFKLPVGRLEEVKNKKGIKIYIDFAHTPNSLDKVLGALAKRIGKGKLISIISCTGGRDKEKRPMMAGIATGHSDYCIFTADDPRYEDVQDIFDQMAKGVDKKNVSNVGVDQFISNDWDPDLKSYFRIPERQEAIYFAINKLSKKGDTVAICGKGHETTMAIGDLEQKYSDHESVENALNSNEKLAAIVLAAGKGKRLNSDIPKVLRKIADRPLVYYTISNLRFAKVGSINLVVGFRSDLVKKQVGHSVSYSIQEELLGTGHATKCGADDIPKDIKDVFVLNSDDTAFYKPETIKKLLDKHTKEKATITFVALKVKNPHGLGRVVTDNKGNLASIIEEKDATKEEKKVNLVNDGLYIFDRKWLSENLVKIKKKAQGEYLLTDTIEIALKQKQKVAVYVLEDESQWVGINTPEQLENADRLMRERIKKYQSRE